MVEGEGLQQQVRDRAIYWSESKTFDAATRKEVATLLEGQDYKALNDRFYKDLEFGTGGLRGIIGAGTARINIYNVRRASLAFSRYLQQHFQGEDVKIAISFDSRKFSKEFAHAAAEVMVAQGVKVLVTKELRPVPMLSFMVRHFDCHGGVCITASHNPPEYNGYKVYWRTGGQLVPPHDSGVIAEYEKIKDFEEISYLSYAKGLSDGLIVEVGEELDQTYFDQVANLSLRREGRDNFRIAYSPLHGTGRYPVCTMLERFGFRNIAVVADQAEPDGNFPTVKSPNPEDSSALERVIALGEEVNADLIMATDPDTDRIGIVVREHGSLVSFNGNQLGCLLTEYVLSNSKELGRLPENPLVIKTIVTSELQRKISEYYGAHCDDTLTGFKWICDLIEAYETGKQTPYRQFVCGGEESYGFLAGSFVRDKDAVAACCLAAEMTAWYKSQGLTLSQVLDHIYLRHGAFFELLGTLTLEGAEGAARINEIMNRLRATPPHSIREEKIIEIRDFLTGSAVLDPHGAARKQVPLTLPSSNVLQFILKDQSIVSVRPSGTEPKIKFYVSVRAEANETGLEQAKQLCRRKAQEYLDFMMKSGNS